MKWNQVTWYSSVLAIILFVSFVAAAFYLGEQIGLNKNIANSFGDTDTGLQDDDAARPTPPDDQVAEPAPDQGTPTPNPEPTPGGRVVTAGDDWFTLTALYAGNNQWSYVLEGTKPTPCTEVSTEVMVAESYPEQVTVSYQFVAPKGDVMCAQVITEAKLDGTFSASGEAAVALRRGQ